MWRSLVSAPALGAGGRRFESGHPDHTAIPTTWPYRPRPPRPGQSTCQSWNGLGWEPIWEPCAAVPCMADGKGRGYREDSIYFDHAADCRDPLHHRGCPGRWRGSVSLGFGPDGKRIRRKVSGRTKTEVKDKLQLLHDELREGVRSSPRYTVQDAIDDFLAHGLAGRSAKTVSTNREVLAPLTPLMGGAKLKELTAANVRSALAQLATSRSTRAVQMAWSSL